jgi:hypothetical protein
VGNNRYFEFPGSKFITNSHFNEYVITFGTFYLTFKRLNIPNGSEFLSVAERQITFVPFGMEYSTFSKYLFQIHLPLINEIIIEKGIFGIWRKVKLSKRWWIYLSFKFGDQKKRERNSSGR